MIKFQRVRQETGSYCGPAVMQMLASSLGVSLSQEKVVDACGARKSVMKVGIPLDDLARGLKILQPELVVWMKTEAKIEDLEALVKKNYLVAVDWQGIFTDDEYGDDEVDKWGNFWDWITRAPVLKGSQGHYCVVTKVARKQGYLRFVDPYGHYAGQNRFIAIWEFLERWWDDKIGRDSRGKKKYILEDKLMFLLAKQGDEFPAEVGMVRV